MGWAFVPFRTARVCVFGRDMRGGVTFVTAFLHGKERFGFGDTVGRVFTPSEIGDDSPLDALHSVILESVRIGIGNWRFHFAGVELTVWGELSMVRDERTFTRESPDFFSEFFRLWGCELSFVEIVHEVVTLYFGSDTITIVSPDDGELASVLFDGDELADLWNWNAGTLSRGRGKRETFNGLTG